MFMRKLIVNRVTLMTLPLSLVLFISFAIGQEYPARSVKLISPYASGGVTDITWRSMLDTIRKALGQPLIIENKTGGSGAVGYTVVANAKPDGYTVGHISLGSFINNYLSYDVAYDPIKSFTFIGGVARYAECVIVRSDAPWRTWNELVDYLKAHPDQVRMGITGGRSSHSIAAKWIGKKLGLKWREVTFPAESEGIAALLGGHVDVLPSAGAINILVRDGRARMLLALTTDPIPGYPDVPTFKKVFGKNTMNASGLMGPAGIPAPILAKLEMAVHEGTKDPGFLRTMEEMNMTPLWRSSREFTQDIESSLNSSHEFLKDLDMLKKK